MKDNGSAKDGDDSDEDVEKKKMQVGTRAMLTSTSDHNKTGIDLMHRDDKC